MSFAALISTSPRMRELRALVERAAKSAAPVLIRGERGTGKKLVASMLHFQGPRRGLPFLVVRAAEAWPTAASGAEGRAGTLLFDEIGDMSRETQGALLRTLEGADVRARGVDGPRRDEVRIVASTRWNVEKLVCKGALRADLFYRLDVVSIVVPPLRERVEDIADLAAQFLRDAQARFPDSPVRRLSPELAAWLARYPWPGNVGELESLMGRVVKLGSSEVVGLGDLEVLAPGTAIDAAPRQEAPLHDAQHVVPLRELEADYITWVVNRCGGNKARAAKVLGINVSTLHRKGVRRSTLRPG